MIERIGWYLAGLLAGLLVLFSCAGCAASRMSGVRVETSKSPDGQTRTRIDGPSFAGESAKDVSLPPLSVSPDGTVAVGASGARMWKPLAGDRSWLLLAIGAAALAAGVVTAAKFPSLALGWPLAAAGVACIGLYFYPWLILAGVVVWYIGDILQSRRSVNQVNAVNAVAEAAQAEAARQAAALAVVTRAVANSPADVKATVKRKVADTIAAGSDLDAAIQEAKRT